LVNINKKLFQKAFFGQKHAKNTHFLHLTELSKKTVFS